MRLLKRIATVLFVAALGIASQGCGFWYHGYYPPYDPYGYPYYCPPGVPFWGFDFDRHHHDRWHSRNDDRRGHEWWEHGGGGGMGPDFRHGGNGGHHG